MSLTCCYRETCLLPSTQTAVSLRSVSRCGSSVFSNFNKKSRDVLELTLSNVKVPGRCRHVLELTLSSVKVPGRCRDVLELNLSSVKVPQRCAEMYLEQR